MQSSQDEGWLGKVFPLRGLPRDMATFDDVAKILSNSLGDSQVSSRDIRVYSLANTLKPLERPPSRVATVMFSVVPSLLHNGGTQHQWSIPINGIDDLILDANFIGMTPLNQIDSTLHRAEYVYQRGENELFG